MSRASFARAGIACALLFASSCTEAPVASSVSPARASHARDDASVRAPAPAESVGRFEARGDELFARVGSHAVSARGEHIRVEGRGGRLLGLGGSRLSRGADVLGVARRPALGPSGALVRSIAAGISERVVTRPIGTEQSWHLESRPAGSDALVVRVPVTSGRFLGADERGLRFADEGGEVLYSHATFVDALGVRTPVPCTLEDGAITTRVGAATLAGARYPAVLDPTISPVATMAGNAGTFAAYGDQRAASFGRFDLDNGLVAYVDFADPLGPSVAVQRIDGNGAPVGARVELSSGVTDAPTSVSCSAASCLVTYVAGGALLGKRVDPTGAVLDAVPVTIATVSHLASVAAHDDGAGRLVAWCDRGTPTGTTSAVYARRVAPGGAPVGVGPIALGSGANAPSIDASAFNGTSVVAWDDRSGSSSRLYGVRLDVTGALLDAPAVVLVDSPLEAEILPALAERSSDLLIAYHVGGVIRGSIVSTSPTLSLVAPTDLVLNITTPPVAIDAEGNGLTAVLGFVEDRGSNLSYTLRTGTIPAALDSFSTLSVAVGVDAHSSFDVAPMSGGTLVVESMVSHYVGKTHTSGYEVQSVLGTANAVTITTGGSSARAPSASFDTGEYVLAHLIDDTWDGRIVAATRFSATGTRTDPSAASIVTGPASVGSTSAYTSVASTFFGSTHAALFKLKIYTDNSRAIGGGNQWVSFDTAPTPNVSGTSSIFNTYDPNAVLGGATFLTVASTFGVNLFSARVDAGGAMSYPVSGTTGSFSFAGIGQRGVAWSTSKMLVFVPSAGAQSPTVHTTATSDDGPLGIDLGTSSVLVVRRAAPGATATAIEGVLLDLASSTITKTFTVDSGAGLVGSPRVVFDGANYDVFFMRGTALQLVRVTEAGNLYDPAPSTVATGIAIGPRSRLATASNRAGSVLVAYEWFDATAGVRAMRITSEVIDWNGTGTGMANGTACTGGLTCASGHCVDGVCCASACGGGVGNDCQACSAAASGTAPDGTCGPTMSTVLCRPAAGVCDVDDYCSGATTTCPADSKVAAGTVCGLASTQPCETAEMCDGASDACIPKRAAQGSPVCRAANGLCDVAEVCDGVSMSCPADAVATTSVVCRGAAGLCDVDDRCDGVAKTCPADAVAASGTSCRGAAGPCDVAEACDGSSVNCPADDVAALGTTCRAIASSCDSAEACDGSTKACPTDTFLPATQICRGIAGGCDIAEYCTGLGPTCPVFDARKPVGAVCRPSAGPCDVIEVCDGSTQCPANQLRPMASICRPASSVCDSAETCSGLAVACPSDRLRVDGSGCDDGLVCNGSETCQAGVCTAGEALACSASAPCIESLGECAVPTRPGGAPGCTVAAPGARGESTSLAWVFVLAVLAWRRRVRVRISMLSVVALALVAQGCVCGVGAVSCEGACVDVGYDERNCGACGLSCGSGQCVEGECVGVPTTGNVCADDAACIDGNVCDGVERCVAGRCRDGVALTCDDGLACTTDSCSVTIGSCVAVPTSAACGVSP